jgi:hypothetical protein
VTDPYHQDDRAALIATLRELTPACREQQVQFTTNGCNCWAGINQVIRIIEQLDRAAT